MKLFIIGLLLPSLTIAQLISGVSFMDVNKDINFSSNSCTDNLMCVNYNLCIGIYPCTTKVNTIDFSVQNEMVFTCVCPCIAPIISSPRPFFISKKDFNTIDLRQPLQLSDTAEFYKIDTVTTWEYGPGCYLPFTKRPCSVIIIKSHENKYVLISIGGKTDTIPRYSGPDMTCWGKTYFGGYYIHWYLQQNGTTDFSGINQSSTISEQIPSEKLLVNDFRNVDAFNVLGQRIPLSKGIHNNNNMFAQLHILKRQDGTAQLLLINSNKIN
jgi:hypothetical protein